MIKKASKVKLGDLKVKSIVTSTKSQIIAKTKGNDGGYTWVG